MDASHPPRADPLSLEGQLKIHVYYEDTDFTGFVYHANFLKYFDRGREAMLGLPRLKELYREDFHFAVAKCEVSFKKPAHFGDELICKSSTRIGRSPLVPCQQKVIRYDEPDNPTTIAEGLITLVTLDQQGRPRRIDDHILRMWSP